MSLNLNDVTSRMAAQAEVDRLSGLGDQLRGRGAPSRYAFSDAELDPDIHAARDIVTSQMSEAMLTEPDVQAVDRVSEDDVSRAIIELARLRGEKPYETQALVVDMAGGNRDVLSLSHAIAALAGAGERDDHYVPDEAILSQTHPSLRYNGTDWVGDQMLALSAELELALAGQCGGLQVPQRQVASPAAGNGPAGQVARIVAQNPDLLSQDTGLPFKVCDVGSSGDPAEVIDPEAEVQKYLDAHPELFQGNIATQSLGPVPASRWNQYARTLATGTEDYPNPGAGENGSIPPHRQLPRNTTRDPRTGATRHRPERTVPLSFTEAVSHRGGQIFLVS